MALPLAGASLLSSRISSSLSPPHLCRLFSRHFFPRQDFFLCCPPPRLLSFPSPLPAAESDTESISGFFRGIRGFRKARRRLTASLGAVGGKKNKGDESDSPPSPLPKEKLLLLDVNISLHDDLPNDPEVLSIAEMLKLNVPMAMKIAFDGLKGSYYKSRDPAISDVGRYERAEMSVLLCNDRFIRKVNKEWMNEDRPTDVLPMSRFISDIDVPVLMLGDVVISVESAARQAEERSHTLLDEVRILMVHGLLHLLGFYSGISKEADTDMEKEEKLVLKSLGWKSKGEIRNFNDSSKDGELQKKILDGNCTKDQKSLRSLRFYRPKFKYIFCDMDGTLLNSKSQVTEATAEALRESISRGVNIVIATGKTRSAVISALKVVDLVGKNGVVSDVSPGVFLQGLLVYGRQGREIYRKSLDQNVCREVFTYSMMHEVPLVAFSGDRCFTPFDHPLVDSLHATFHEPKAEVIPSVEKLLAMNDVQKVLFMDTAEGISSKLRPYWAEATQGRASVVQAQPDMLEIIPPGICKGLGVKVLLEHLGVSPKEGIMAIGDGENDVEMLELAALGIALGNGSEKAKAAADVVGATNDEDGVARAIYEYAF